MTEKNTKKQNLENHKIKKSLDPKEKWEKSTKLKNRNEVNTIEEEEEKEE